MAFAAPDPNEIVPGTPPAGQAPVVAGGAGVAGSSKAAATPGQNLPAKPSAQLSAYLGANQPQASNLAGQVANTVGNQVQAAGNAINPAVNTYTGQLYTVPTDATVNQTVANAPSTLTPEQTATYQQERGAAAKAPNSAQTFETTAPYQDLSKNIQGAVEQANLWNSGNNPANLTTALRPYEGSNATAGDTTLDALLLSQSPSAYSQIQKAVAPAANLQGQLSAGTAQANQALRDSIAQDQAATASATAAPQTFANNLNSYLQNAVNTATEGNTAKNKQILDDLSKNDPTQEDLGILGITPEQWANLSGELGTATSSGFPVNLSQYLTQKPSNVTAQNVATPLQYSDVAAMQKLLGANAPVVPINSTTADEAGTATTPNQLNQFNFQGAEAQAQTAPLLAQAQALQNAGNTARAKYADNHFGGLSPEQFNAYMADLARQMDAVNKQILALGSSGAQPFASAGVAPTHTGDNNIWENVGGSLLGG